MTQDKSDLDKKDSNVNDSEGHSSKGVKSDIKSDKSVTKKLVTEDSKIKKTHKSLVGINNSHWLVVLAVALIVVTGVAGYVLMRGSTDVPIEPITLETTYEDTGLSYRQRAEQLAYSEDYDGAQKLLQDGANDAQGDIAVEAKFYLEKARLALNNGRYEDGLSFAISSDEGNPTVSSAVFVAESAMKLGDNETAIKYFTLAADRTSDESKSLGPEISEYYYYINMIEALGGTYEN